MIYYIMYESETNERQKKRRNSIFIGTVLSYRISYGYTTSCTCTVSDLPVVRFVGRTDGDCLRSLSMCLIKPSEFTHPLDDLFETSNIRTLFECATIGRCMIFHLLINARHHIFETSIDLFGFPGETLSILCHFQSRHTDTTRIGGLTGNINDIVRTEDILSSHIGGEVGTFTDSLDTILHKTSGGIPVDFILCRTREC